METLILITVVVQLFSTMLFALINAVFQHRIINILISMNQDGEDSEEEDTNDG